MNPPDETPKSQSANFITADLNEEASIIIALSNSNLYKHFLERFLDGIGRSVHVPWWMVHFVLYSAIWVGFIFLIDVPKLYPNAGYFSFGGEQIGEFIFTTFMLYHIRKSRLIAILAAARIKNTGTRLIWLRRFLAPAYWGWIVRWRISGQRKGQWVLRTWAATACVLTVFLGGQYIYYHGNLRWFPHAHSYWGLYYYPYPQLIFLYATIAKASMMVAGFAQFWWLYGLMGIIRGKYPSSLNSQQRKLLYFECCQAAIRFSMVVSAATAIWVFGHALDYGFTFWSYLYSVWLALLFIMQTAVIKNLQLRFKFSKEFREFFGELLAPDFAILSEFTGIRKFATLSAVWVLILCPGPLAQLAASISKL